MAENELPQDAQATKEQKRDAKRFDRITDIAMKHIAIVNHYKEQNIPKLIELNEMFQDYPIIPQKYNELAVKRNDLVHKYNETGDKKLLKEEKRLSKTIPDFDDTDKENDKKLKALYARFLKLHKEVQGNKKLIELHTQYFYEIMESDPRLAKLLNDRTETYNEVFDMD